MSISVTLNWQSNRSTRNAFFAFLGITLFCVLFDRIYALFAHDVKSLAMTLMFLYPLILGVFPFLCITLFCQEVKKWKLFRLSFNAYNSGIAILTLRSALQGVFDIAMTHSKYLPYFLAIGLVMLLLGTCLFLYGYFVARGNSRRNNYS